MLYKLGLLKIILRHGAIRLFNKIENNNNCNFSTNGEKLFLYNLLRFFSTKDEIVVFDVGANTGEYSQMFIEAATEVQINFTLHGFEPTEKCFSILQMRFGTTKNVKLNRKALSDNEGKFPIYYDKEQSGLASLYKRNLSHYNIELSESENIEAICAKNYIDEHQIKHISFLKIDIEGHELNALYGFGKYMTCSFIDFIQFEYGGANLDSHTSLIEIYTYLNSRDFTLAKVMPQGLDIRKYDPYMENYSYGNYVAISNNILDSIK